MNDIMLDIETLGNTHDSVMIQIAACYFDRNTGAIGKTFSRCILKSDCEAYGFKTSESTIKWWSEQKQSVLESIFDRGECLEIVLNDFSEFIDREACVWCHATFDFPILQNYFNKINLPPLNFRKCRDIRTLVDLSNLDLDKYDWSGKTHDALDDCIFQVNYCKDAINEIQRQHNRVSE